MSAGGRGGTGGGCGTARMLHAGQHVGLGQAEESQQSCKPPVPFGVETGHELLGCDRILKYS